MCVQLTFGNFWNNTKVKACQVIKVIFYRIINKLSMER